MTYIAWQKAVLRRDNYRCTVDPDHPRDRLCAHHVKAYKAFPDLRYDVANGITLCSDCHKLVHASKKRRRMLADASV